jgi:hypothetical protein
VSPQLERDLGAWASGALPRERLLATHGAEAAETAALHERLTGMAAGMSTPDAEAGWAALASKIGVPAPVVPLRRHVRRRRTVSLLVAAALVVGGSALAAVRTWTHRGQTPQAPAPVSVLSPVGRSFGPSDRSLVPAPTAAPAGGTHGSSRPSHGGAGPAGSGPTGGGDGSPSPDDPQDRDHGTGNDGSHDDHGGGNDGPSGSLPDGSHGHGH